MNRSEKFAVRLMGWVLKGFWWLWLGCGLLLYVGGGIVYIMDHLLWPDLPFWNSLWVIMRAQFVGWLDLPNVLGKVMAVTAALWLYIKILSFVGSMRGVVRV